MNVRECSNPWKSYKWFPNTLKLIVNLKIKYQQSFVIATHDESILEIADRVLYLKDGKIKKEL